MAKVTIIIRPNAYPHIEYSIWVKAPAGYRGKGIGSKVTLSSMRQVPEAAMYNVRLLDAARDGDCKAEIERIGKTWRRKDGGTTYELWVRDEAIHRGEFKPNPQKSLI